MCSVPQPGTLLALVMTEANRPILLPWDSSFFGFPIAKLSGVRLREADLPAIEKSCRLMGVKCLYFLADASWPETLEAAYKGGFMFVDMRWDLELSVNEIGDGDSNPAGVRVAKEEEMSLFQEMARRLHSNTRFFKDARFSRERAAELYAEWLRLSFQGPKKTVLAVTTSSGRPAGYVACESGESEGTGRIGLIGVDESARGHGLGTTLIRAAIAWLYSKGARRVRVATQADNIAAIRLYIAAGFSPAGVGTWFHRWYV